MGVYHWFMLIVRASLMFSFFCWRYVAPWLKRWNSLFRVLCLKKKSSSPSACIFMLYFETVTLIFFSLQFYYPAIKCSPGRPMTYFNTYLTIETATSYFKLRNLDPPSIGYKTGSWTWALGSGGQVYLDFIQIGREATIFFSIFWSIVIESFLQWPSPLWTTT